MSEVLDRPQPKSGVLEIAPYVPGTGKSVPGGRVFKLSSNETPLGPSPHAVEAYRALADDLAAYPDGGATELRLAIAERYGLNADRIVCGAGSDELISLLCQAYLEPGDEVLYSQYGFLMYRISTLAAGGVPVVAPEDDLIADVDAILAKVTDRTRIVFLANPNNPTGSYLPHEEVKRLHAGLPRNVILALDAAYAEYVRRNDYESGLELVANSQNVVMLRTFSKIHGLAALRLGWAYCPAGIADVLNRVRGPFNVNAPANAAGVASLKDAAHGENAVAHNETWLPWLAGELKSLGLDVLPSVANFILVRFREGCGLTAGEADAALQADGVFVRRMDAYGLPDSLRVTIGTEEANRLVVDSLSRALGRARG